MRRFAVRFLAACPLVLVAPVLFAQQPGAGLFGLGGQRGTPFLLANKSVQEELKMTLEQVGKYEKVSRDLVEKNKAKMEELFKSGDKEKMAEAFKTIQEDANKAADAFVADNLKPEQVKRLKQIELQQSGARAFAREDVRKSLNLTDKQDEQIKSLADEVRRD